MAEAANLRERSPGRRPDLGRSSPRARDQLAAQRLAVGSTSHWRHAPGWPLGPAHNSPRARALPQRGGRRSPDRSRRAPTFGFWSLNGGTAGRKPCKFPFYLKHIYLDFGLLLTFFVFRPPKDPVGGQRQLEEPRPAPVSGPSTPVPEPSAPADPELRAPANPEPRALAGPEQQTPTEPAPSPPRGRWSRGRWSRQEQHRRGSRRGP